MDRESVMRWVGEYERAWRSGAVEAVGTLFTENVDYRVSPFEESKVGIEAVKEFWLDDEGQVFDVTAWPVAVEDRNAVVRLDVAYGDPVRQEYRDVWLLRFAADGRVEDFEEWPFWPGKGYSATPAGS